MVGVFEKLVSGRAFGHTAVGHQRDEVGGVAGESHFVGD
jgi:hypothetical protein